MVEEGGDGFVGFHTVPTPLCGFLANLPSLELCSCVSFAHSPEGNFPCQHHSLTFQGAGVGLRGVPPAASQSFESRQGKSTGCAEGSAGGRLLAAEGEFFVKCVPAFDAFSEAYVLLSHFPPAALHHGHLMGMCNFNRKGAAFQNVLGSGHHAP